MRRNLARCLLLTLCLGSTSLAVGLPNADASVVSTGDSVVSTAPVLLPGQKASSYSTADMTRLAQQGGDPAVLNYWTPARMASAIPDVVKSPPLSQTPKSSPAAAATKPLAVASTPVCPLARGVSPNISGPVTSFPQTVGAIFYVENGQNMYCSAPAVNSPSRRELATAGHCVHSGQNGTFNQNTMFIPAYDGRSSPVDPYGRWTASTLRVSSEWAAYGSGTLTAASAPGFARDVAFITLFPGGNGTPANVVDRLGGNGFNYNGPFEYDVTMFGYPKDNMNGQVRIACYGARTRMDTDYSNRSLVDCKFSGGASGGPWFDYYDNSSQLGNVLSVTSTASVNTPRINGAMHFDNSTYYMFQTSYTDG